MRIERARTLQAGNGEEKEDVVGGSDRREVLGLGAENVVERLQRELVAAVGKVSQFNGGA